MEARDPSGIRYVFGETPQARVTNSLGIFRWHLERQEDTRGNRIEYSYLQDAGYAYLREIRYNFTGDGKHVAIVFNYQPRPDPFTDRRSRAPMSVGLRCTSIQVWELGRLVRAYRFAYVAERATGAHSLLASITQIGDDGVSTLPPTTFTYTQFDPAAYSVVSMTNPPPVSLLTADADLVDINADSLPDVVYTPSAGHRYYLNRGPGRRQADPVYPNLSPLDLLSNLNVRMADMDGNGQVDLLVKPASGYTGPFYYYAGHAGRLWERGDRITYNLNPGFDLSSPNVGLFDANNDKRVDVMVTTDSRYYIWLAHADDTWSAAADYAVPALAVGTPLVFSNPRVRLGDMTGDGLQDMVFVRDGLIAYFPHSGNGVYGSGVIMRGGPYGIGDLDLLVQVGDINKDGLDDLVLPGHRVIRYWLNRGDGGFASEVTLTGTPYFNQTETAVRLADMDGDGAVELLFNRYPASAGEVMQYVDFDTGTHSLLLRSVDNGLGRTITIDYQPSTTFYTADWDAGQAWATALPFPVQVVSRATVHDANSGSDYVVDYRYRDGYYDGEQKEFRGFAGVTKIERGDETAPTTVTDSRFDTGSSEESRKGLLLEKAILGEGGQCTEPVSECYRREVNQAVTRRLYNDGPNKIVSYSFITQTDAYVHENLATPVQLRQTFDRDDYGNLTREFKYGQVCGSDVTCGNDEVLKYTEYAYNADVWIVNKPSRVRQTDAAGSFVSEARMYYDGADYVGLPLTSVTRGDLTRKEENLGPLGGNRFIPTQRQAYDAYGNVVGMLDANGNLTTIEYDPLVHAFPVVELLRLGAGRYLSFAASYDIGFGKLIAATDYNGNPYTYAYDTFGRLAKIVLPGDTLALPTQQFAYTLASPRSSIATAQRERSGQSDVRLTVAYFDGLGRKLQTRGEAEDGQFVVEGALTFNARQSERDQFLPYFDATLDYALPPSANPHTTKRYDPLGRVTRTINPDGTYTSVAYRPLAQVQRDEEDNTPTSVHSDTPKTLFYDGLDRLVGVDEVNGVDGGQAVYHTAYSYDPLGNLTRIVDAQGNVKTMQYDALSRKVAMNDPDRHTMAYTYDDKGNLIETRDAKGQVVRTTYDAASRPLKQQWVQGGGSLFTAAVYHYDNNLSIRHLDAVNTLGQLSYVEDQAGVVYFSYNPRGKVTGRIRRFADEGLEFVTRFEYDAMDRLTSLTYPEGTVITHEYNTQGLLERIPGYVDDIDYTAAGQQAAMTYPNGVTIQRNYDLRQRLRRLQASSGPVALQDLTYAFDNASNIVSISDGRPDKTPANDQAQTFAYDDLYRLTSSAGTYGQIDHTYDSIGNMIRQTTTAADPRLELGEMRHAENGAGPHALTFAGGATYTYDANGNRVSEGASSYTWNSRDQPATANDGHTLSSYVYDFDGQRARKTIVVGEVVTTALYLGQAAEVRGDQLVLYVLVDESRVAEMSGPFDPARLISGFGGAVTPISATPVSKTWHVPDHLGGISLLLDPTGTTISELSYYPYGLTRYETTTGGVPYRFAGKELDETALYDFGARLYDPKTGAFLSVDPLPLEEQDKKLQQVRLLNVYGYANANPVCYYDPSGRSPANIIYRLTQVQDAVLGTKNAQIISAVARGVNSIPFVKNELKTWAEVTSPQYKELANLSTKALLSPMATLTFMKAAESLHEISENPAKGLFNFGIEASTFSLGEAGVPGEVLEKAIHAVSAWEMLQGIAGEVRGAVREERDRLLSPIMMPAPDPVQRPIG